MKKKKGKREEEKEKNDDEEAEEEEENENKEDPVGADGGKLPSDYELNDFLQEVFDDGVYSRTRSKVPDVAKLPDVQDTMDPFCEISDGEHPSSNTGTKYAKSNVSDLGDSRLEKDIVSEDKKPPATSTRASKKQSNKKDVKGGKKEEARLKENFGNYPFPILPATHNPTFDRNYEQPKGQKSKRNQSKIGLEYKCSVCGKGKGECRCTKKGMALKIETLQEELFTCKQEKEELEEQLASMRSEVDRLEQLLEKERTKLNLAEKQLEINESIEEDEEHCEGNSEQDGDNDKKGKGKKKDNKE